MDLGDLFTFIMSAALPPGDEARWRLSLVACGTFFMLIGFICYAFGVLPFSPGFVSRTDLQQVAQSLQTEIRNERASTLDQQLFGLRVANCDSKDPVLRREYRLRIDDLLRRYRTVTGSEYNLPNCADL